MTQLSIQRCPYCFAAQPHGPSLVACPVKENADGSTCTSAKLVSKTEARQICEAHGVALVPHCPQRACQQQLPLGWDEVTTTCIAMAGTRASGKTVFVGMAANLLLRWGRLNGWTVTHYDKKTKATFEEHYGALDPSAPLYASTIPERADSGQKAVQQVPVLLRIQESGKKKDHVLVLRDVAGEDVQDAGMDRDHFRFLAWADGLILMVDPSDCGDVRSALVNEVDLQGSDSDPAAVWGNLDSLASAVKGTEARGTPVAVTISKFDLVLKAATKGTSELQGALASKGLRVHQDPSLRDRQWNRTDADLLDQELRTLCSKYLDRPQLVERARDHEADGVPVRFFALSSLGHAPKMGQIASHGTPSYRCLDPIKWFLMQAGLVGAS